MSKMGCIFDLDGVIVDTAKYHFKAWKRLANELGFDFDEGQNEQLKGVSRYDSLNLILGWGGIEMSEEDKQKWMVTKNDWYLELITDMNDSEILDGVAPLLAELQSHKIPIALGSASKNSQRILKAVGISHFFHAVIDGNKVKNGKPHPETFLLGAEALGLSPNDCLVFEDAPKGVKAGKAGGFKVIGVGKSESLYEADYVVPGFSNITFNTLQELFNRLN